MVEICRFCDADDKSVVNNVRDYAYDIQLVAQIKINLHQYLPQKICNQCVRRLMDAISFRALCQRSEEMLLANYLIEDGTPRPAHFTLAEVQEEAPRLKFPKWEEDEERLIEIKVEEEEEVPEQSYVIEVPQVVSIEEVRPVITQVEFQDPKEEAPQILEEEQFNSSDYEDYEELIEPPVQFAFPSKRGKPPKNPPKERPREKQVTLKMRLNLPKNGPWVCEPCNKVYMNIASYYSHWNDHHAETPKKWFCHLCGSAFRRQAILRDHLNVHRNIKPYSCDICGAKFARKYAVSRHMRMHISEKMFKCKYCPKSFSFVTDIKRHETCHTGVYIYYCSYCKKGFNRKKALGEHETQHMKQQS